MNDLIENIDDVWPLSLSEERKARVIWLVATAQNPKAGDNWSLAWKEIKSATKEYRTQSAHHRLNPVKTADQAVKLSRDLYRQFGLSEDDFVAIARELVGASICAGFFGIYLDRWPLDYAQLTVTQAAENFEKANGHKHPRAPKREIVNVW